MFLTFQAFFSATYSFPQPKRSIKCPFITNLVPGKVEKENHIRKVQKSEERIVISISRNGHLKSCARFIVERSESEIRKKQHDFKSVHFE